MPGPFATSPLIASNFDVGPQLQQHARKQAAADVGHVDVGDDEVESPRPGAEVLERLDAICAARHPVTAGSEQGGNGLADGLVVVSHDDMFAIAVCRRHCRPGFFRHLSGDDPPRVHPLDRALRIRDDHRVDGRLKGGALPPYRLLGPLGLGAIAYDAREKFSSGVSHWVRDRSRGIRCRPSAGRPARWTDP